jgi:hypothetical protein
MSIRLILVVVLTAGLFAVDPAPAQTQTQTEEETTVETPPPPAKAPKAPSAAGPWARGKKRVGFYGGAGSTLGQTYFILGGGAGFMVTDGLEVGADFEGWLFQDPTIWKLSPQVRYTIWQLGALKPYVGAFYRWTWVSGDFFEDYNSWGGRAGITYARGRGFVGAGMVYERFEGDFGSDNDVWYPEISFSVFF